MSQDIQNELDTPLQRLAVLPEMMSWIGEWNATDEYYKNNVVTDPLTTGSYIYTGFSATISGGLPPSQVIGPSIWTAVGSTVAAGVQQLKEGDGILVDGSDTIPKVSNTGVITVITDGGLENIGTSQFPVFVLGNSVSQVQNGLGIAIDNTNPNQPQINNTGILNILPGGGISVTGQNDLTLANTGVISIGVAPGTALTITSPGQNPVINNTGVGSITEGLGIAKEPGRPANEPQLNNAGVISIVPRNIEVAGGFPGPGDKELKMINSVKTLVFNSQNLIMTPAALVVDGAQGLIPITQSVGTFWEDVMENGPPSYTNFQGSTFILDFALKFTGTKSASGISLSMYLQDNTSNPVVELGPYFLKAGAIGTMDRVPDRIYLFSSVAVKVEPARASGFRKLTGLRIRKTKLGPSIPDTIRLASSGPCSATWFNQTVPFPS